MPDVRTLTAKELDSSWAYAWEAGSTLLLEGWDLGCVTSAEAISALGGGENPAWALVAEGFGFTSQ